MKKLLFIVCTMGVGMHNLHAAAKPVQTRELQKSMPNVLRATLEEFSRFVLPYWKQNEDGSIAHDVKFQQDGRVQSSIRFAQRKSGAELEITLPGQAASFIMANLWMQYEDKRTVGISPLLQLQHMTTRKQILGRIAEYLNHGGRGQDMIIQAHYNGKPGSLQASRETYMAHRLNDDIVGFLNRVHYAPIAQSDRIDTPVASLSDLFEQQYDDEGSVVVGIHEPLSEIRSLTDLMK